MPFDHERLTAAEVLRLFLQARQENAAEVEGSIRTHQDAIDGFEKELVWRRADIADLERAIALVGPLPLEPEPLEAR